MPKPKVFISHRWDYNDNYYNLVGKFEERGFQIADYSVPEHDPFDLNRVRQLRKALAEQIRQCNYFLIFARSASDTPWIRFEVAVAGSEGMHGHGPYHKPILSVRPWGYEGNIPRFIQDADNQGGSVGFNAPSIIAKIESELDW